MVLGGICSQVAKALPGRGAQATNPRGPVISGESSLSLARAGVRGLGKEKAWGKYQGTENSPLHVDPWTALGQSRIVPEVPYPKRSAERMPLTLNKTPGTLSSS